MPHELGPEVKALLAWARKEILDVKLDTAPNDPGALPGAVYRIATVVMALSDLTERLLVREHEHGTHVAHGPPRFGGG